MTFGDIKLWDTNMKTISADKWLLTSSKPCGGTMSQIDEETMTVQHSTDQIVTNGVVATQI